MRLACY